MLVLEIFFVLLIDNMNDQACDKHLSNKDRMKCKHLSDLLTVTLWALWKNNFYLHFYVHLLMK
jgi:hypothetical protein